MKTKEHILTGGVGLIAQLPIGAALFFAHALFTRHWNAVLPDVPLPRLTAISFVTLQGVPLMAATLFLAGMFAPPIQRRSRWWPFVVAIAEALILALLILGLGYPAGFITYEMN